MPFGILGVIGSAVFVAASLGMAHDVKHQPQH